MSENEYAEGGYVGVKDGHLVPVVLHPDECLIRMTRSPRLWCSRADHPTPTSDCTAHLDGIYHESEKTL